MKKQNRKEVRKPVADNFAPKRLALNFDPPMVIMEYLVIDSGKLYHHKMRLDSILRKPNVTREDVLNYVKTKHYLYFVSDKIKDDLLYKFIDKILLKKGLLSKSQVAKNYGQQQIKQTTAFRQESEYDRQNQDDDFEYLNDDEDEYYQQDYEDYEDPHYKPQINHQKQQISEPTQKIKKNTFLTYCQQYQNEDDGQNNAEWDLDMDEDADFV